MPTIMHLLVMNQMIDWQWKFALAKNALAHEHFIFMFRKLTAHMPARGLWKIFKQYKIVFDRLGPNVQPLEACTRVISKTAGLPCYLRICELQRIGQVIRPHDLYSSG